MIEYADFCRLYNLPARDPGERRARPVHVSGRRLRAAGRRNDRARRDGRRRLAYLDSTFPWQVSGFRYREALALLEARPDTLFFSQFEMTDPFPVPVLPLARFPELALGAGVTDAYAVFELFLAGLCGALRGRMRKHPMAGEDLSRVLRLAKIALHGAIYPGGGSLPSAAGLTQTRAVVARLASAFSYVPDVLRLVPGVQEVPQAMCDVGFYAFTTERWKRVRPLRCLFAAEATPRKGFDVVVEAFRGLDPAEFQLDVAGPHEARRHELPAGLATFHGWVPPERLRALHQTTHVFVSPVSQGEDGVTDGFPTQAATDAMSSGCLLVSANPADDRRTLDAGVHYVECPAYGAALRTALVALAAEPPAARQIAEAGSRRVRQTMDVRIGVAHKLAIMGL